MKGKVEQVREGEAPPHHLGVVTIEREVRSPQLRLPTLFSLLYIIPERAATGIGFHVNAHKKEYMCYNQTGDITTLDGTLWN